MYLSADFKLNLICRKLEQDHKEKLAAVRSELMKEMEQIQQQAFLQREELEAEIEKVREDESFLRDHLSISVKVPEYFCNISWTVSDSVCVREWRLWICFYIYLLFIVWLL